MDSEKIDELLSRYWNCETSVEEEQQLRAYFRRPDLPEHLRETAALFRYFNAAQNESLAEATFDRQLMEKLSPKKGKMSALVFNTMRIAAGIAVLVAAVWLVRMELRESTPPAMADTYSDPKMAFEETKKALLMISKSFGAAEEQARKISVFNEAQKNVRKEKPKSEL